MTNANHVLGSWAAGWAVVAAVAVFAFLVGELSQARARIRVLKAHLAAMDKQVESDRVVARGFAHMRRVADREEDRAQAVVDARAEAYAASAQAVVELVKIEQALLGGTWPAGLGRPKLPLTRTLGNQVALRAGAGFGVRAAVDLLMRQVVPDSALAITFGLKNDVAVVVEEPAVDFPTPRHAVLFGGQ